jgi:hypothetical protein
MIAILYHLYHLYGSRATNKKYNNLKESVGYKSKA